ncbi:hypothetical protein GCM10027299_22110 [Larkinella ripae]
MFSTYISIYELYHRYEPKRQVLLKTLKYTAIMVVGLGGFAFYAHDQESQGDPLQPVELIGALSLDAVCLETTFCEDIQD